MRRLSGPSLGVRLQRKIMADFNIQVNIDPSIWEEPATGALGLAPINPAVSGCEGLAIEL